VKAAVLAVALALAAAGGPARAGAQALPAPPVPQRNTQQLAVRADPSAGYRPLLELGDVLASGALRDVVRSGIPLRLRATVELASEREDLGPEFRAFLIDFVEKRLT